MKRQAPPAGGPTHGPDLRGRIIGERYTIERFIGGGGSSSVYAARDGWLRRPVAVKVIHPEHARSLDQRRRIRQEALVGARLSHPNLAQIFDYGTHAEDVERGEVQPFLVMPLLQGRTLRELVSEGPLPWPRAVRAIRQLLAGLGALHAAGVLHRDVKLDNCILVREHGREVLKVIDLGLAKVTREQILSSPPYSAPGAVVGTLLYTAPEVALGEEADERSDLYSAGVALYELLTRRPPFRGSAYEVMVGHVERPPVPPSELATTAGIPARLDAITLQALAKRREDRFSLASEFDAALAQVLEAIDAEGAERDDAGKGQLIAGAAEALAALAAWTDFNPDQAEDAADKAARLDRAWSPLCLLLQLLREHN